MKKLDKESVVGISALLVHAANIDEIYSDHEKDLIKNFINSYLMDENSNKNNLIDDVAILSLGKKNWITLILEHFEELH